MKQKRTKQEKIYFLLREMKRASDLAEKINNENFGGENQDLKDIAMKDLQCRMMAGL